MAVKVKMLKTQPGCPDGITAILYQKGGEYELPSSLARLFIEMGAAQLAPAESEMIRGAPTGADMGTSPADKSEDAGEEEDYEPPLDLDLEEIVEMSKEEKASLKKKILKMHRDKLEALIDHNELGIPYRSTWRDETVTSRVIEALGL